MLTEDDPPDVGEYLAKQQERVLNILSREGIRGRQYPSSVDRAPISADKETEIRASSHLGRRAPVIPDVKNKGKSGGVDPKHHKYICLKHDPRIDLFCKGCRPPKGDGSCGRQHLDTHRAIEANRYDIVKKAADKNFSRRYPGKGDKGSGKR